MSFESSRKAISRGGGDLVAKTEAKASEGFGGQGFFVLPAKDRVLEMSLPEFLDATLFLGRIMLVTNRKFGRFFLPIYSGSENPCTRWDG